MKRCHLSLFVLLVGTLAFAAEGSFQRTLQVSGPVDLEIQTGAGNITVHAGGGNTVQVNGTIKGHGFDADERVRQLESNPPIEQDGNNIRVGHVSSELLQNISISYDITVPTATSLHAHTGSGNERIEGIRGPAEARTGSGGIEITNLAGELRASTGSGSITLQNIQSSVNAHTGSGSIRASGIDGAFDGRTGSGNIDAEGKPTSEWRLHTGSGSVTVRLPSEAAFDLAAHTGSGSISVDQPVTVHGTVGRHELRGKVRGGGTLVSLETGSGNIHVE